MSLSPQDWHRRFVQQSGWTKEIRRYLFARLGLDAAGRVLEVGCGTGAITAGLRADTSAQVYGLDLNPAFLHLARQNDPGARFVTGNALRLPFAEGVFDAVVCHFFLLWIEQPGKALAEMARAARPGGAVIAFAEPDYGGRIDYPPAFAEPGRMQAGSLRRQGADPEMGRKLSGLFHAAGLSEIEIGVLGAQWQGQATREEIDSEWATLEADLEGQLPAVKLRELRESDEAARAAGKRVLFVPTFYAVGFARL